VRRPLVVANWKMHKTVREALTYAEAFLPRAREIEGVDLALAPPFTALEPLSRALLGSPVAWAAQNVHAEPAGAFTGEVSAPMLAELGCAFAIVGHSERRRLFGESSGFVARKVAALVAAGIRPILCVGEQLEEREAGRAREVVERQLEESLPELPSGREDGLVVAYEPVWAIGTGRTATPALAAEAHGWVRAALRSRYGGAADRIRIQYGGSVKPENASALLAEPEIDGALVGGASLDPESFAAIAAAAVPQAASAGGRRPPPAGGASGQGRNQP